MPQLFPTETATAVAEEVEEIQVEDNEVVEAANPEADMNATLPIPPAGSYLFKVSLLDRGEIANPKRGRTNPKDGTSGRPFISVGLKLHLVDEGGEFHGFELTEYVTSLVMARRGTSSLHHFMNCIGETLPTTIGIGDLEAKVRAALESNPLVQAKLEWKASRKSGPGKYDREEVVKYMRDFPNNPDGDGKSQIYIYKPKSGAPEELRAMPYISKFLLQG